MLLAVIIALSVTLVLVIVLSIVYNSKKAQNMKCRIAAGNILREEYLDHSLRNTAQDEEFNTGSTKLMLCLKTKNGKKKIQYVFNPENKIYIGRDKSDNNIYIHDTQVSKKHCCIYLKDNQVYLQDLNSSNGTIIERGLFKKYSVHSNYKIILKTGDRVIIGSNAFSVDLFYYDMSAI